MILPCGPIFLPRVIPVVRTMVHAAGRVRLHIGHHVFHPVRHAVHAMGVHPATVIGFACRTAPAWTAAGLLALPLLAPLNPAVIEQPTMTPSEVQGLPIMGGSTPLPMQQFLDADAPAKGLVSATPTPVVANADVARALPHVVPQLVAPTTIFPTPLPSLPSTAPATQPYAIVSPDKIPEIIAREFPAAPQAVPEPSSLLVLTSGFYGLRWIRRRRQPLVESRT